jgi:hypothetical protein
MIGEDEMIMERGGSSENSVNLYHATRRRIPEDNNIQNFFLFSTTPLPDLCPIQLTVPWVQLFFGGDQTGQGLNLTNRLSPLSSPKFIFNLSEHGFSIVRSTPPPQAKIKEKESLYDEVMLIPRCVRGKEFQVLTAY